MSADADRRNGMLAGLTAYSLWGVFPLVFHQLRSVDSMELLLHRILWSYVAVVVLLLVQRDGQWLDRVRAERGAFLRLAAAGFLVASNWLVYIWAVNHDHVVEGALGYYINPLLVVGLGVFVLHEHLRRGQIVALALGAAAVAVLTVGYHRVPWVALFLASSFAAYGFIKKAVPVSATTSLAVETLCLLPISIVGLAVLQVRGDTAFLHGSVGRDLLMVGLGVVTALPLLLFGVAARRVPLSVLGLVFYLTPTLQLVCGVLVFHEPMPTERLIGFVLVWIALVALAVDAWRHARAPRPVGEVLAAEPV